MSKLDEILSETVRKYPALYNKSIKEFKDRNVTSLIWSKVAKDLKMKSGKDLASFFIYTTIYVRIIPSYF